MSGNGPELPVSRKQRLLLRIEAFSRRRYGVVLAAAALVFVASTWIGSRIEVESDVLDLIPRGNKKVDTFRDALRDFGSIDYLMVLIEAAPGEEPDDLEDLADVFTEELAAREDLVESVEYRFRPDPRFLELFTENAFLFLSPHELPRIAERLTDAAIAEQIRENRIALASPTGAFAESLVGRDPLGLLPFFVERLLSHRGALKLDISSGYYLSTDGRSLIMLVKPKRPSQDLAFSRELLGAADAAAAKARARIRAETDRVPTAAFRYGGNPAVLTEEARLLGRTIGITGTAAFFAVLGLYLVCYRRVATLIYSSLPLMLGQAMTFAVAALVLGSLNSASAALPALLMGLGTDFTILMYARYVEERQAGRNLAEATEAMVGETGLGVFTGAITSAGTFYALCISGYRGLSDLGLLIGTGIVLCGVAIVFMLPAMIAWHEGGRRSGVESLRKLHLQSIGLEKLIAFSVRHRKPVIAAVAIATLAAALGARGLDFDANVNSLRSTESKSYQVQQDIAERFGASLSYMMAIAEGRTLDEAVAHAAEVKGRLEPFLADRTIGSYESILDYLPPVSRQEEVLASLRAEAGGPFDAARIRATLAQELDRNGFRSEAFSGYLAGLDRFLAPARPITLADLEGKGLGRIVDRFVRREQGRVRIVTYLYPTDPQWRRRPPPGLVEALTGDDAGITVTGTNVVGEELRQLFLRDATRAWFLGFAIVAILLVVDFRSLRLTAIALAQLVAGVLLMLGTMRLLGMQFNYANAFVATMIMGVGIDYSIHIVHRLALNGGVLDDGVLETGKGVVLAALTNVAGFGTLTLGNYPAMRSVGLVALIGSVTCLLTALTLVPAMMVRAPGRSAA
jgi:predicted RND superfamily exporter protein